MKKRLLTLAAALCLGLVLMIGTALADGSAVEDVKVEADGVTVAALADENTDCTLIAALYDGDGRMVDIKMQTIAAGEDWNDTLPLIAQQAGADMVKVFLVDSKTSQPVSQSCAVIVDENGWSRPDEVLNYAVLLQKSQVDSGDRAKLLLADGSLVTVNLEPRYADSASLYVGDLYTYETNADGEYRLSPAPMDGASSGFDHVGHFAAVQPQSDTGGNAGYIDGYEIADDAVIFLQYGPDSFMTISGARLRAMDTAELSAMYYAANDKVALAFVARGGGGGSPAPRPQQSVIYYGYVVSGVVTVRNGDGDTVYNTTLFRKDGEYSLNTVSVNDIPADSLAKGNAIAYKVNDNGEISEIVGYASPDNMVAVTDISGSELWIDGNPAALDPDVVVLVADLDDRSGVDVGDIYSISPAKQAADGAYIPNAMVLYDKDGEVAVIVYDVNNGETL